MVVTQLTHPHKPTAWPDPGWLLCMQERKVVVIEDLAACFDLPAKEAMRCVALCLLLWWCGVR